MLKITIETIPHKKQRYETVGDWFYKGDALHIRVSDMKNWRYEFLVAFHELAEVMICKHQGVGQKEVDDFDIQYEEDRKRGLHSASDEPGDDEEAPYRVAHYWATNVERILAVVLGVNWNVYSKTVEEL